MKGSDAIGLGMYSHQWFIWSSLTIPNVEDWPT